MPDQPRWVQNKGAVHNVPCMGKIFHRVCLSNHPLGLRRITTFAKPQIIQSVKRCALEKKVRLSRCQLSFITPRRILLCIQSKSI